MSKIDFYISSGIIYRPQHKTSKIGLAVTVKIQIKRRGVSPAVVVRGRMTSPCLY